MKTIKTNNLVNNSKKAINNFSSEALKYAEEHNVMNKIGAWFFAFTTFFLGMTGFGVLLRMLFDVDIASEPIWSGTGMAMMAFCCLLYPICKKVYHMMKNAD